MTEPTPEVLKPSTDDTKARKAGPTTNPEAPFGWMKDPKTGETRPKKRPGKQGSKAEPPPSRPANQPRQKAAPPGHVSQDYSKPITELCQGVWMIMAAVPTIESKKLGKFDLRDPTIKIKAQAAILKENGDGLIKGVNLMAQHNPTVRSGVEKLAAETGPAWILPAMFVIMPFVGQSLAMWRAPVEGDVTLLAKRTEKEFDDLMNSAMREAAAEQQSYEDLKAQDAAREAEDINRRMG